MWFKKVLLCVCDQGPSHRLEIHPDIGGTTVVVDSNEELRRHALEYERKVQTLREEVDHLRTEVMLVKCIVVLSRLIFL